MSRINKRLPSPAMLVAILACVIAVAGTATAATGSLGLGIFNKKARSKVIGVGPLIRATTNNFLPAGAAQLFQTNCPPGFTPVGGGARVSTGTQPIEGIIDSYPTGNGWAASIFNDGVESHTVIVHAICARASDVRGTVGRVK